MSWKDKLKENQGGSTNPSLGATAITVKRTDDGKVKFAKWDKELEKNVFTSQIKGVLIGQANKLSSFCTELGKNGGQYQSSYYFSNKDIAVFGQGKLFFKGEFDELLVKLNQAGADKPSKKKVLIIKTEKGLCAVETNMVIGIDQIGQFKDNLLENMVTLEPRIFDHDEPCISKKSVEFLGKLAVKNPPLYAHISLDEEITEEIAEQYDLEAVLDNYAEWKKFRLGGGEEIFDEKKEEQEELKELEDDDLPF